MAFTVTYYFNGYSSCNWTNCAQVINGSCAGGSTYTTVLGRLIALNANTCPGTDLGIITKVELRGCKYHSYMHGGIMTFQPVFAGGNGDLHDCDLTGPGTVESVWIDITSDTNAPSPWTWGAVQGLDLKVVSKTKGVNGYCFIGHVTVRITWEYPSGSADLAAQFTVGQGREDLLAQFEAGQGSQDLSAQFTVRQWQEDLFAEFFAMLVEELEASPASSYNLCTIENEMPIASPTSTYAITNFGICDLPGAFIARQDGFAELSGGFEGQDKELLSAEFVARQDGFAELSGGFEGQDKELLSAEFVARHADSAELFGCFEVRHIDSVELLGKFLVGHDGLAEFLAEFIVQQSAWKRLSGGFVVRHIGTPRNLHGEFEARRDGFAELLGTFIVRHSDLEELLGYFEGQDKEELSAEFIVRHAAWERLHGAFDGQDKEELLGTFEGQDIEELHASFDGQDVEELHAAFKIVDSEELSAEFIVRHSAWVRLSGRFTVRHSASLELSAGFIARHAGQEELKAGFYVWYYSADLLANIYIRPEGSTANDFQIKDLTRGLTIHDDDRSMTVTPQRKMKVK